MYLIVILNIIKIIEMTDKKILVMAPRRGEGEKWRHKGNRDLIILIDRCQLLPNFKEWKCILIAVKGPDGEGGIPQKQRP